MELPYFGLQAMEVIKSPAMVRNMVPRQNVTIPDLFLYDNDGRDRHRVGRSNVVTL